MSASHSIFSPSASPALYSLYDIAYFPISIPNPLCFLRESASCFPISITIPCQPLYVSMSPFAFHSFSFLLPLVGAGCWYWLIPHTQSDPQNGSAADWGQLVPRFWISTPCIHPSQLWLLRESVITPGKSYQMHVSSNQQSSGEQNLNCWTWVHDTKQVLNIHRKTFHDSCDFISGNCICSLPNIKLYSTKFIQRALLSIYWCLFWGLKQTCISESK